MADPRPQLPTIAIITLFKNEAMNMEEFIRHHAAEGVGEFILLDDGSTDNGRAIAKQVGAQLGVRVVVIKARSKPVRDNQQRLMTAALPRVRADWLARADLDEFFYARTGDLREYLAGLPDDVTSLRVEWRMFASEGAFEKHPESLINAYVQTSTNGMGAKEKVGGAPHKSLARTAEITNVGCHNIHTRSGTRRTVRRSGADPDVEGIRINHYRSQSREYWLKVQVPRTVENSLMQRKPPKRKYNRHKFGKLDPPDGGIDTELRDKRNALGPWLQEKRAEAPVWPRPRTKWMRIKGKIRARYADRAFRRQALHAD